jgi:hypothetical protein
MKTKEEYKIETAKLVRLKRRLWFIFFLIVLTAFVGMKLLEPIICLVIIMLLFVFGLVWQSKFMKFECPKCKKKFPLGGPLDIYPNQKVCIHCKLPYY